MRTKRIVGIALIMFCIFLLFVYSFGFLANKSSTNSLIAKKDDIATNSVVIVDNRTSSNVVKENTATTTTQTQVTPVNTTTTTITKPRTVQRVTRAS